MEDNTALYDEILRNGPSQSTLHIILARMKHEGRVNEVIKWCMAFLRVYPRDMGLRRVLAESYLEMGSMGQAETEFVKVSSMMNDLLPVYAGLARMYATQNRFREAAGAAEVFLAHHPEDVEMRELLQQVEKAGDPLGKEAEGHDQTWPVLPDDDGETLVPFATPTIAELYFSQGQLDAAVETYERVMAEHPGDSASAERLLQLKDQLKADTCSVEKKTDDVRAQQEKLLITLEKWLPRVAEIKYG